MFLRNITGLISILSMTITGTAFATAIEISSYDIQNTKTSGYGGWYHTYDGTITSNGTNYDYKNGSGTLNDDVIGTDHTNTQLFVTGDLSSITLNLVDAAIIDSLSLYSFSGSNAIAGSISGVYVTINGVKEYITTSGFGVSYNAYSNPHEFIDLSGTSLSGLLTDTITLSGFTTMVSTPTIILFQKLWQMVMWLFPRLLPSSCSG